MNKCALEDLAAALRKLLPLGVESTIILGWVTDAMQERDKLRQTVQQQLASIETLVERKADMHQTIMLQNEELRTLRQQIYEEGEAKT